MLALHNEPASCAFNKTFGNPDGQRLSMHTRPWLLLPVYDHHKNRINFRVCDCFATLSFMRVNIVTTVSPVFVMASFHCTDE